MKVNELFYHINCLKTFNYKYKQCVESVSEKEDNNAVALKKTIKFLKEKDHEHPDCPVEVGNVQEQFNFYLEKESLPPHRHVTSFGMLVLGHAKGFKIDKNKHGVNVFTLKDEFVKTTAVDPNFESTMKFLNNAHKVH